MTIHMRLDVVLAQRKMKGKELAKQMGSLELIHRPKYPQKSAKIVTAGSGFPTQVFA